MISLAADIAAAAVGDEIDILSIAKDAGLVVEDFAHSKCAKPSSEFL